MTNRLTLIFRTHGGRICKMVILIAAAVVDPSGTVVSAIRAAIEAVFNVKTVRASISLAEPLSDTATASEPYATSEDKLVMTFLDSEGSHRTYSLPGPMSTMFASPYSDQKPGGPLFENLKAYILEYAVTEEGNFLSSFVGARRSRRKKMKNS
jgi:hypothetical protein